MLNERYNGLTLDEAAEKAGGYVTYPNDSFMDADYRAMSNYCRQKGIRPIDITEEEYLMFAFPANDRNR